MTGTAPPTTVCLDIGEVVIDETRVWSTWADLLGISPFTLMASIGAAIGRGEDHHVVLDHLAGREWSGLDAEHASRYGGFEEVDLYHDVRPALDALSNLGVRVVLAGNQPAERGAELDALDLPVDHIVTSAALEAEKPERAFFDRMRERLPDPPAPDRCVYVGDRIDHDIGPAAAAGLRPVWLRRGPWAALAPPGSASVEVPAAGDLRGVIEIVHGWLDQGGAK